MILQAEQVCKSFPQGESSLKILSGVSLSIEKSETVAIMGRSGCGKSTFISLCAGLDRPDSGQILIQDTDLKNLSGRDLNRFRALNIGIIFQQFYLLDHLTAFENVRLPLDLNRESETDRRARAMIERVGMSHRLDHFPHQLSRGECQRVAIARTLVMKPKILFADEPTGSLDVNTGREVMDLLLNLVESDKFALLMVTHDPALAGRCNRVFNMNQGVLASGSI